MKKYNYEKLMAQQPTSYGTMLNSKGQEIDFLEHPINGGASPIICACHELRIAVDSTFFGTADMIVSKEYEPTFEDGILLIGGYADNY